MRDSFGSTGERFCFHGPSKWLGHGLVEVGDELFNFGTQHLLAGEIAASEELSHQDGKPDFDLVEPRGVSGCEVEGDAMLGLTQEGGAGELGSEHAGLALEAAVASHEPDDGLGKMDIEIVANDIPPNVRGGAAQQATEKARKILFGPGIADHAFDLAGGDIEGRNQGLSAVAAILELTSLDLAGRHRQSRRDAFEGLDAGHLVDRDGAMGVIGSGRGFVDRTDVRALGIEGGIRLRGQPVADAMWLEVGFFFKKRPTERCEMFGTRPRRMASSAISRWLQWLMGLSLSDGLSHVIATRAQICSGVNVAGAPERCASASRAGTSSLSAASRQRLRQYRTVLGQTPRLAC